MKKRWVSQSIYIRPKQKRQLERLRLLTGKSVALLVREAVEKMLNGELTGGLTAKED